MKSIQEVLKTNQTSENSFDSNDSNNDDLNTLFSRRINASKNINFEVKRSIKHTDSSIFTDVSNDKNSLFYDN